MLWHEEKSAAGSASAREVLAAWACCGLVVIGALALASRGGPAPAIYAGVHLPGPMASTQPALSIADEFADLRDVPDEESPGTALAAASATEPVKAQQCWLRSVVHRLI
jgi:hypothetical protein